MNVFNEWESSHRRDEVLREAANRHAWKLDGAVLPYEETATLVHRVARWLKGASHGPVAFATDAEQAGDAMETMPRAS